MLERKNWIEFKRKISKWWNSWYFQTHTLSFQGKVLTTKELRKEKLDKIFNELR